ncbi:hypothetical protein PALB_27920 [Pseudoalteromonas luteoviolacea B = ATCC 29581]|nr:hypothetical protein PALB_27920 [Pseudoalteromonas luteoviolacea B = ATCC 29581]
MDMNLNATLVGELLLVFAIVMTFIGYFTALKTGRSPFVTALITFFCSLLPPLGLIFIAALITHSPKKTVIKD